MVARNAAEHCSFSVYAVTLLEVPPWFVGLVWDMCHSPKRCQAIVSEAAVERDHLQYTVEVIAFWRLRVQS